MKVFKKTALLLSVIVLAVVLSIGAIAGVSQLAEGESTLGETYSAVQVTTDGKVNLKVYYSTIGTAETFVAQVIDPVTEKVDKTYNYTAEELELGKTSNGYCVKVPLTPSQMTHTVRVKAVAGDVESTAMDFTVAEYAQEVLATETLAEYHDAMRMLLNWGTMAQNFFGDATANAANANVFVRSTNPVGAVTAASMGVAQKGEGDEAFKSANVSLAEGTISMSFIVEVLDGTTIDDIYACYTRDDMEGAYNDLEVTHVAGNNYKVTINNISVQNWARTYTVEVYDIENGYTYNYSLFNYLTYMLTDGALSTEGVEFTAEQKNVARSMYQFYQVATGNTGAQDCAHVKAANVYWVAEGTNAASVKCTLCHADLGHQAIGNDVNAYAPASAIVYKDSVTGKVDVAFGTDSDGTQYARFNNFYANRDNWGDIGVTGVFAGKTGVSGQYLVIKFRVGAEGSGRAYIEAFANTNKGSATGLTGKGQLQFVTSNDNEWHTVIINLAERVVDPSATFVDEGDGTYNVRYLSLRMFAGGTDATADHSAAGRYVYIYTYEKEDGSEAKDTIYGTPLTEEEMTERGYTLTKVLKQSVSADAYVDLSYMALCDSLEEAKSLVDTTVYEKSTDNNKSLYLNIADDSCARHLWDGQETVEGNTYSYNCSSCGEAIYTKTVPASVAAFISPYTMSTPVAKAENNKLTPNTNFQMTEKAFALDGVPYYGFNGTTASNKTAQFIWMRAANKITSASDHERWTLDLDQAKYLVIKARGNEGALSDVTFQYGTSGAASYKSVKLPLSAAGADKWGVYVFDLSKVLSAYHVKNAETDTYELDTFYFHISTFETTDRFELGYIAFVEDWADVDAIVDETTFYNVADTAGAYNELNTADHTCVGEHTDAVQVIDGVYKTACSVCGHVSRDHGIKADAVNAYWAAETLHIKATKTGTTASGWASITGSYAQKELITEDGETFLRLGDAASNGQWGGWFPISTDGNNSITNAGRYMVMKVRNHASSVAWNTIPFWIPSKASGANWASGSFTVLLPQDDQWHTIVVDLATRSDKYIANEDGTYDLSTMHLRPLGGNNTGMDASTDEVFDIAYMAFFDDLADVKDIVKEDTFEMSKSSSSNIVLDTATGACAFCTPTYVTDETDARGYHYECSECGKMLAMDYYTSGKGGVFTYNNGQYAGTATLKTDEAGFSYMSFLSTGTSGTFFDYNTNTGAGGGVSDNAVRAGRYLVMKLKGDTAANVTFHIGTDDQPKSNNNYVGGSVGALTIDTMPKDWTVVVVDLTGLAKYTLGGTHKIFMSSTTGGGGTVANGAQVDLAYVMLVNDFDDIAGLTEGENVQYYGNTLNNAPIAVEDMCDGTKHTYDFATTTDNGATVNTATCIVCGATKVQTVSADINWFAPLSGMGKYQHTLTTGLLDTAEGVMYNRYTGTGGNHLNLTGGGGAGGVTSGTFTTGKYIAIKYRVYVEGGTATFGFNVATGDKKDGNGASMGTLDYTSINQGEWRTALIDVSGNAEWTSDGTAQSIYMMITTGGTGAYTFDVAWVAVVDSVEEMRTLLTEGETYYDLGSDWSKAGTHLNQDGSCIAHNATESVSGTTYTYTCVACGTPVKTIELGSSVTKYYSANALNTTAKVYYGGSGNTYKYDADANVGYMETSRIQTIWQRMDHDMATTQTAADGEQYTENVGNAKYLVVKARSSDAEAYISLNISTTGKNSNIGTITEADFTEGVLNATKASYLKILEDGSTIISTDPSTKCSQIGDQYYYGGGISTTYITAKGEATGEWMTYVIDLEAVCGEYYAKAEGQDYYDVDTFYFHNAGTNDIAYAAFVEGSWAEIDALVEEDVVMQITAKGTNSATVGKLVYVADGSDAE